MSQQKEPIFDIHQLAFTELYTPVLEDSLEFFTKLLGMSVVHKEGKSVYLRAYEDVYKYSLILTEAEEAGMGYSAFRTSSSQALERRVAALEEAGHAGEWREDNFGYGRSYRFKDLDNHVLEIFWEVEKFGAGDGIQSGILNRAQRRPLQGVPVRRIDHINMMTHPEIIHENHEFYVDVLGFNLREAVSDPEGKYFATWMSVSPLVHEVALMGDELGGNGRLHHLAFWYGFPQHLDDLADACKEYGIQVEAGPLKHGVSQAQCMYVIEPGGNRIELFGDSGYLIFDPDWEPVIWGGDQTGEAIIWYGGELPGTFFRYGTPRIKDETEELNTYYNPIKNMLSDADQMTDISDKHEENMYRVQNFSVDK